ncbi:hypothetical protein [Salinigranum salinum]|uniref:hypothetical protein n=1 Tax=Salinigranum salinum TaxID=1364937 RepID=UPI0012612921|nr:hypothetical protein [Salinigranum salinum]
MSDRDEDDEIPDHLQRSPNLFVHRADGTVEEAPAADQAVADDYPHWPDKGPVVDGKRLTVMTARDTYEVGEEVRVIHAFEAPEPGVDVYVMGPKPVYGEHIDGTLATTPPPDGDEPWVPQQYDGAVIASPAVDYNYEVTTYRFAEPGRHVIRWELGPVTSNTLEITVVEET